MGTFEMKTVTADDNIPVVYVTGDLDTYSAPRLRRVLWDMLLGGRPHILLQMESLEYIDSSGLGVLVAALKQANQKSGTVALACPQENVSRILRITGLDQVFPVYAEEREAREALGAESGGAEFRPPA